MTDDVTMVDGAAAPPSAEPSVVKKIRRAATVLPRYSHRLMPQSLVASEMVADPQGAWVKRDDVLKLLANLQG